MVNSSDQIDATVINEIEEMAKCFFTPSEIAVALGIEDSFMKNEIATVNSDMYNAFYRGWVQSEYDQRKCVFKLALSGSSPAQTMVAKINDAAKIKMIDNEF
jgi:hypothetical protein